jgi:hypothetical protein
MALWPSLIPNTALARQALVVADAAKIIRTAGARASGAPPHAKSNSRVAAFVTTLRDIFRRIKTGEHNLAAAVVGEATDALIARRTCAV